MSSMQVQFWNTFTAFDQRWFETNFLKGGVFRKSLISAILTFSSSYSINGLFRSWNFIETKTWTFEKLLVNIVYNLSTDLLLFSRHTYIRCRFNCLYIVKLCTMIPLQHWNLFNFSLLVPAQYHSNSSIFHLFLTVHILWKNDTATTPAIL